MKMKLYALWLLLFAVLSLPLCDLRHSHVSLLIEMGFSVVAIANRVGHESIDITYRYAHMLPTAQSEMATKLDIERGSQNVS